VQNTMVIGRRLRADTPDAWDAWRAGDINYDKAERISRTLGKLVRDNSKALLNHVVVDVAVCKTGELLGRWLNQFVARIEPDEQDERIHRSLADRYVSVRPDLDGVSFLSAALSSLDAATIDRVLTAIAAVAHPGDTRTLQQRRADALVDVPLGRISNGCQTRWDGNETYSSDDVYSDDAVGQGTVDHDAVAEGATDDDPGDDGSDAETAPEPTSDSAEADDGCTGLVPGSVDGAVIDAGTGSDGGMAVDFGSESAVADSAVADIVDADLSADEVDPDVVDLDADRIDDWDLPASAFRPDPPHAGRAPIGPTAGAQQGDTGSIAPTGVHPCTCGGRSAPAAAAGVQIRPVQVNIGIIISAASLLGFTNTPGQLADRSALIPADTIRDLAARPGTLFHRLVTDTTGNLLEVNELGRFPSRKLALAVTYRDGVCNPDTCHVSATHGDLDHVIPAPEGPTTASNLKARCRKDHRAKTHAGHQTERTGPHTTTWTTPSGHTHTSHDDPLPVEEFPADPP
ncbi:MAG TPA: DUF222 domain-containing protein, partial [Nakamurella sp.]|nr:DUF222 domain-containing protein [Nakamurella sp.]